MTLIAEASTVHFPSVDRSAAPAPTLTTMWLWGFCHRYSSTTPRYVTFLAMSNIAREWWASVGAAARAIPTGTAKASNARRAREPAPTIRTKHFSPGLDRAKRGRHRRAYPSAGGLDETQNGGRDLRADLCRLCHAPGGSSLGCGDVRRQQGNQDPGCGHEDRMDESTRSVLGGREERRR